MDATGDDGSPVSADPSWRNVPEQPSEAGSCCLTETWPERAEGELTPHRRGIGSLRLFIEATPAACRSSVTLPAAFTRTPF